MNLSRFNISLAILLTTSIVLSIFIASSVIAKPISPNPGQSFWPSGTIWGTNLRFENTSTIYVSEIWWGVGTSESKIDAPPDPPSGLVVEFLDNTLTYNYATWVKAQATEPASYTWQVQFRKIQAANPNGGTVSLTMENADTRFVPQDHSVVLENTNLGIKINLRAGGDNIKGLTTRFVTILAALNVDNAVNIQSIENLDPLIGKPGDNLRLRVTVKNTGRYTDNYSVSAGGSLDPTILNLAPDHTDNVIVTTTLPSGTQNIVITAAGNYATDQDYVTATGIIRGVQVVITPLAQENNNGGTLVYNVTVKNLGNVQENFQLTKGDSTGWTLSLDNTSLLTPIGENKTTNLTVTIPTSATGGTFDNIWVKAASKDNAAVFDNKSCLAQVKIIRGVSVSISPPSQENDNGGALTYTVTLNNLGNVQENFQLTKGDNTGWSLNLDNTWLLVPKSGNGTTKLTVTIPANATGDTYDNIWVKTASKDDNTVFDNKSCLAHVIITRGVQVVINPSPPAYLENENGRQVIFNITVNNTGNYFLENFKLENGDNAGWPLAIDNNWLLVPKGGTGTTKLTVNIPSSATGGTIDNVWIKATSHDNALVFDNKSCLARVKIIRGVSVSISPSSQENVNGGTLTYTVTVNNPGNVQENFQLTRGDNAGWTLNLDNSWLLIPKGENRTTKLNVTIPSNATGDTLDSIWVKATSKDDITVFDNKSCLAHVIIVRGVNVSISPSSQSGPNGATLTFTVTISNTGNVSDNYTLENTDNAVPSWVKLLTKTSLVVPAFSSDNTTKENVIIPSNAIGGTVDNITVTVNGTGDSASSSCTATVTVSRSVSVSISPSSQSGANGTTLTYTVTITNTGNVSDNYALVPTDNASPSWSPGILPTSRVIDAFSSDNATLSVTIPSGAIGGTVDNIKVTATGTGDNGSGSCTAQFTIVRSVSVSISPPSQENVNGGVLTYTVTVNNIGNVQENFQLTRGDNAGWTLNLDNTWLLVPKSENGTTKLTVNIPANATGDTWDNIWVKATSKDNSGVFDNKSCLAHVIVVRGVNVAISPHSQGAPTMGTLNYTINVVNTGNVSDNYSMTVNDNVGWSPSVLPTSVVVPAFSSDNTTTLSVTIPSGAVGGTVDNMTITATSQTDGGVSAENSCIAIAFATSSLNLVNGWNLVGFSLTSENTTPRNAFTDLTYLTDYVIYSWSAPNGPYILQGVDQPLRDNIGYWTWINVNKTVSTSGVPLDNRAIHLVAGWNLVAFPIVNGSTTPNNVFTGLTYLTDYIIYYWSAPTGPYVLQNPDHVLENDLGYWIWVKNDKTVIVP